MFPTKLKSIVTLKAFPKAPELWKVPHNDKVPGASTIVKT